MQGLQTCWAQRTQWKTLQTNVPQLKMRYIVSLTTIRSNFLFISRPQSNKNDYEDEMMSKGYDVVEYGNHVNEMRIHPAMTHRKIKSLWSKRCTMKEVWGKWKSPVNNQGLKPMERKQASAYVGCLHLDLVKAEKPTDLTWVQRWHSRLSQMKIATNTS